VLLEYLHKLVVYNSRDGTFKSLKVQKRHGWMFPDVYQESLISLVLISRLYVVT